MLVNSEGDGVVIGDIAGQTAPNPTSQFPEHISDWYLTHPFTISLLSVWLAAAENAEHKAERRY